MAHNSINPQLAAQRMIERGIKPLEPYTRSGDRWKCKCLTCGAIVYPRYATVVTAGKGGCDSCARNNAGEKRTRQIREIDFPRACAVAGVTPLSEFINSFEKIELRCNACGYEFRLVWSPLRDGRGCPKCARASQSKREREKSEAIAIQLFLDANVKPIGPFAGLANPYPGICLKCGSEVKPTPSASKQGQRQRLVHQATQRCEI